MTDNPWTLLDQAIMDGVVEMPTVADDAREKFMFDLMAYGKATWGGLETVMDPFGQITVRRAPA